MKVGRPRLALRYLTQAGGVLALFSLTAPLLGGGSQADFILYRILGISRSHSLVFGLLVFSIGMVGELMAGVLALSNWSQKVRTWHIVTIKTLYFLFLTVLIAASAEGFQRLIESDPTKYFMFPPNSERVFSPDQKVIHGVRPKTRFTVNHLGLRGGPPGISDGYRILVLGGSTVECLVQDDDATWPAMLQQLANATRPSGKIWVGNAGRSGLTSFENILQLKHLPDMLPRLDMVIVLIGGNDLAYGYVNAGRSSPATISEQDRYDRTFFSIVRPESKFPYNLALYRLYQAVERVSNLSERGILQGAGESISYTDWVRASRSERATAQSHLTDLPNLNQYLQIYRENLERMANVATARNLKLVFVTQPLMYRAGQTSREEGIYGAYGKLVGYTSSGDSQFYSSLALDKMIGLYNEETLSFCNRRGLTCIEAAKKLEPVEANYYDGMHLTDIGNKQMAHIVWDGLKSSIGVLR